MKNKIRPCIILFTLAATTVLCAGCSSKTELQLSGTVEATQIEAASEVSGKVIQFGIEEGNSVKKGDVLAVLDSSLQELTVRQQQAIVEAKQAKLDELKAGTRPQQLEQARESVKSAGLAVVNGQNNVKNARTTYDYWLDKYENIKKLVSAKNTMENELADAKYKVDTAKQQLDIAEKQQETLQTQRKSAESQLDLLKQGATSQSIKAAEADLEQSRLSLEQARLVLGKYQVLSPMDGTYSLRNVNIGDLINTGTSVGTISDLDDLWMYVFLPQKYLINVKTGQELELRVKALGDGMVRGRIVNIADNAEFTPKNVETDDAKENTVFKVKIKFLDPADRLKPGMTADAIIPLK